MKKPVRTVSAFEARTRLGEMIDYIRYSREPCLIERHGKTVAALVDIQSYEKMSLPETYRMWLAEALSQIVDRYKPEKVVLFGSAARGDVHEGSDIDLLIIKETPVRSLERIEEVLKYLPLENPAEPHVYTPREIEGRLREGDSFLTEALRKGTVLYEVQKQKTGRRMVRAGGE